MWTVAGLTFLSGCGDTGANVPEATAPIARGVPAIRSEAARNDAEGHALASRHTIDARVVPAWYGFDDPPLPTLRPADGESAIPEAVSVDESEPTVVLPAEEMSGVVRLAPAQLEDAPEPPRTRYDVGGRYTLDATNAADTVAIEDQTDAGATASDAAIHRLPPIEEPKVHAEPEVHATLTDAVPLDPPAVEAQSSPRDEFRRLPAVDETETVETYDADASAATSAASDHEPRYTRPSDVFAEEAQPVSRFTRLPPVEEPARDVPPHVETSVVATPTYRDGQYRDAQFAPPPFVLPPIETMPSVERAPLVVAQPPRHREMDLINERAGEGVRVGYELAHRGALYSAQSEFAAALRVIAQALDAQENGSRHAASLDAGLAALDESDDFLAGASSSTSTVDVAAVVAKHRTPVMKDAAAEDLTPITALQRYYTYAQEQLAAAVEHEPAASNALYGMGKVQTTLQSTRTSSLSDGPKAIALHQAALLVDQRNFMAANELGVLMARCGRYDAARAALSHSVSISPQPAVWRNLAAVHERLGENSLAANAKAAAESATRSVAQSPSAAHTLQQPVVWLEPTAFAQSARPQADLQRGQPATSPDRTQHELTPPTQTTDKKSGFRWPLW